MFVTRFWSRKMAVLVTALCVGGLVGVTPANAGTADAATVRCSMKDPAAQIPRVPDAESCEWVILKNIPYAGNKLKALSVCQTLGAEMVRRNPDVRDYKCTDFPDLAIWVLSVEVCTQDAKGESQVTWWFNANSGMVFEVDHSRTNDGANVDQWPFNRTNTQYWLPVKLDDGYGLLVDVNSGKCLGVIGGSTNREASVVQWTCNGNPDQKWAFSATGKKASNGSPIYQLVNLNSRLCLDVPHSATGQGTRLWQFTCNGTPAQGWY